MTDNASNLLLAGEVVEMPPHRMCIAGALIFARQTAFKVNTIARGER